MPADTQIAETVTIGGDLTVGRIGYGAMQLAGPKVWGEYPDHERGVALLREVVAAGVTFIDTADVYGPHSNEELIREALHPYPDDLVIATKGGFVRSGPEYTDMGAVGNRHYLRQAAYMSARRLGLDHIDLYYLHTPTMTDAPFEAVVETLAGMRQDGLIRHIGLSNVSADQLRTALSITEVAAVTVHYNVAVRQSSPRTWCSSSGVHAPLRVLAEVAAADEPFVVLFDHDAGGEPDQRAVVGEDADDVGAAADLAVEALERVGRAQLRPVVGREGVEGEQVFLGLLEQRRRSSAAACAAARAPRRAARAPARGRRR